VEQKFGPTQFNAILLLQAISTHGTEVTPRSNIVKKYFND